METGKLTCRCHYVSRIFSFSFSFGLLLQVPFMVLRMQFRTTFLCITLAAAAESISERRCCLAIVLGTSKLL